MIHLKQPNAKQGGLVSAFVALLLFASSGFAQADAEKKASSQELIVHVKDITSLADLNSDFARRNILQTAFHEAARDEKWLGKYKFKYNHNLPKEQRGYLEFNVIRWDRSVANMYEMTISARFVDLDGESINLGTFHGSESGIAVTTNRDVGETFRKVAESAFREALEKLAEQQS